MISIDKKMQPNSMGYFLVLLWFLWVRIFETGSHYVACTNCTSQPPKQLGLVCGTSFDGPILPVEREGKKQVTATTGASTCICQGEK